MRRYHYENKLAKVLLMFSTCHTIAIAWFVLSKLKEKDTDQVDRNHETIHAMQWTEITMAVGTIMFSLVILFDISAWWLLVSPFAYYIWYFIEWVCKLPFGNAYRKVSFEQEAYNNEGDSNYVENRRLFCGWLKFVFYNGIIYLFK